jgi:hypothetical protein
MFLSLDLAQAGVGLFLGLAFALLACPVAFADQVHFPPLSAAFRCLP